MILKDGVVLMLILKVGVVPMPIEMVLNLGVVPMSIEMVLNLGVVPMLIVMVLKTGVVLIMSVLKSVSLNEVVKFVRMPVLTNPCLLFCACY